ncbi:restriction endonuclease subunit S [Actinoplanes sp. Pm04-4]|uniref:Restriction endonuclease subunit S n=1 Tax=Paractinoplanes pyxinae TaxID=2997416 RepID=A0ABT4ATR7_9ACTN|nr:restriction endonuclease subunit S [Actinoplanes pyxinae]MCY1137646.1 restriction endonuclease subunit S [Actinoplanes pyxinae]
MDTATTTGGAELARGFARSVAIPWPLVRSSTMFDLKYGKALTESSRRPGQIPVFGSNGVTGWHDTALFTGPGVVLGRKGMGNLGVKWVDCDYWVIDTAYSMKARQDVDLRFAYYLVGYVGLNHLKDGSSNPSLTREAFGAQLFPLPPLDEQRRIAGVLNAFDDLMEANRRLARNLEDQMHAVFAAESFDTPPVFGGITLGDLAAVNPRLAKPTGEAAYVDMAALPTDSSRITSMVRRAPTGGSRFQNSDTLLARLTPCLENGKAAFVDVLDGDEVAIGSTEFLVLRDRGGVGCHWPYMLTRSQRFRDYAIANMNGSSGRQRVSADTIANYPMALPNPDSLARFRPAAETAFATIRALREEIDDLTRSRDELLPLLMSGKVRVSGSLAVA